ncbi:MAG: PIG-L family deacetylase, partial [Deltaproteobacteria bacterium]|nr:PIG-L family deacetylase [Deltaproteobacteria bacterium]
MRATEVACLAAALAACGRALPDGEPLAASAELAIVAHQDDDLLFMQPDLGDALARRDGVTTVYVTAGNGKKGVAQAEKRYAGLREAYARLAGVDPAAWRCGWIELAGRAAEHCRHAAAGMSLVFLGYPDGGKDGELPDSLLRLWNGAIARADTVARRTATYDRAALIETVAGVIRAVKPRRIRTLEVASTHGRDHSDHMLVGALAVLAAAAADHDAELVAYRGYANDTEPANAAPGPFDRSARALRHYAACADGCAPCGEACASLSVQHDAWLR